MKRLSLLLLAAMLVPSLAMAEHAPDHKVDDSGMKPAKAEIDSDGNGLVSRAEFMAYQEKRFVETDADKDGNISDEEHKASMGKWKAKRDEWRAKMKDVPPQPEAKPATDKP